jgi:hypothetical protein
MTSPQPQDWQSRLQDLKNKLDSAQRGVASFTENRAGSGSDSLNQVDVDFPSIGIDSLQSSYQKFLVWFNSIPASGKLLAIAGGGLLSLTLIKTVFQLITSLITLSVFGIIIYLVYRFWILPTSE